MDANKNSAVFDTLMALKPEKVVQDGAAELAEQQRLVGDALTAAFKVGNAATACSCYVH